MAGMPQRRARRDQSTMLVPLRIPPDLWQRMSDTERIVALLGGNLDNIHQCVSIPYADADIHTRNNHVRIFEISVKAGLKLHGNRERDQGREQALSELARALIERDTRMHTASEAGSESETGHSRDTKDVSR